MKIYLRILAFTLLGLGLAPGLAWAGGDGVLATAGNGDPIGPPGSTKATTTTDGTRTIEVPEGMVYVPAGRFAVGTGATASTAELDGYCIGKFSVTNAEYKAFLDATGATDAPRYWSGGTYPAGKASHPVSHVSLIRAREYAAWVGRETGRKVVIPSALQWEKAARGPQGFLYPWGNTPDSSYRDGVLTTRFNYNAVVVADLLKADPKKQVTYDKPKGKHFGEKTTLDRVAAFDADGRATTLSITPEGSVRGWISHATETGFAGTDLFRSINAAGGSTTPVGSYESGRSGYGCYDMAGNIWNWTETTIVATNGIEKGQSVFEIRGGAWYSMGRSGRSVALGEGRAASGSYNTVGFRIAVIPPAAAP